MRWVEQPPSYLWRSLKARLDELGRLVVSRLSPFLQPVARFPHQTKLQVEEGGVYSYS